MIKGIIGVLYLIGGICALIQGQLVFAAIFCVGGSILVFLKGNE